MIDLQNNINNWVPVEKENMDYAQFASVSVGYCGVGDYATW